MAHASQFGLAAAVAPTVVELRARKAKDFPLSTLGQPPFGRLGESGARLGVVDDGSRDGQRTSITRTHTERHTSAALRTTATRMAMDVRTDMDANAGTRWDTSGATAWDTGRPTTSGTRLDTSKDTSMATAGTPATIPPRHRPGQHTPAGTRRLALFTSVVGATALWGLEAVPLRRSDTRMLDVVCLHMWRWMMPTSRRPQEQGIHWPKRARPHAVGPPTNAAVSLLRGARSKDGRRPPCTVHDATQIPATGEIRPDAHREHWGRRSAKPAAARCPCP